MVHFLQCMMVMAKKDIDVLNIYEIRFFVTIAIRYVLKLFQLPPALINGVSSIQHKNDDHIQTALYDTHIRINQNVYSPPLLL